MPEEGPGVISLKRASPDMDLITFDRFSDDYLGLLIKAIDDEKAAWKGLLEATTSSEK